MPSFSGEYLVIDEAQIHKAQESGYVDDYTKREIKIEFIDKFCKHKHITLEEFKTDS
jgi:hypothetical protein